jgi:hypothetical protein
MRGSLSFWRAVEHMKNAPRRNLAYLKAYEPMSREEVRELSLTVAAMQFNDAANVDKLRPIGRLIATIHMLEGRLAEIRRLCGT